MDLFSILKTIANAALEQLTEGAEKGSNASNMSDAELMRKMKNGGSSLSSLKEKSMYKAELERRRKK